MAVWAYVARMFVAQATFGLQTLTGAARAWNLEPLLPLILVCGLVLCLGVAIRLFRSGFRSIEDFLARPPRSDRIEPPPLPASYVRRPNLLTRAEVRFYRELQAFATPRGLRIFVQVRIADLLQPTGRDFASFNRIAQKHVDFVAVDSEFRVWFAVELDDWSHSRPDRVARDWFVDQAFASAGLPLIRFGSDWTPSDLLEKISARVQIPG